MASETEHLKGVEPEVLGQRFLRVFTLAPRLRLLEL